MRAEFPSPGTDGGMIDAFRRNTRAAGILIPALFTLALAAWPAAPARAEDDQEKATRLRESGDILPLEKIVEKAQSEFPGRILEVELEEEGSALHYDIDLLDEAGVVHDLTYDARTGRLIKKNRDD
jgi:uncharacterized membrane protein YkoI